MESKLENKIWTLLMNGSWGSNSLLSSGARKGKPAAGLKNTGNTCFFNSALQFLNAIRPISYPIHLQESIPSSSDTDEDMCFYNQIITYFEAVLHLMRKQRSSHWSINSNELFSLMETKYDGIRHGIQGDAHEVLTLVLDAVIRGTNKRYGSKCDYYDPDGNEDLKVAYEKSRAAKLKGLDSTFEQYVETTEISRTVCTHCGYTSIGFQHGIGLSLPLPSACPDTNPASACKEVAYDSSTSLTHIIVYVQDAKKEIHEVRFSIPTRCLHIDCIYRELQEIHRELTFQRFIPFTRGQELLDGFHITAYSHEFDLIGLDAIVETILRYHYRDDEEYINSTNSQIEFSPCSDSGEDEPPLKDAHNPDATASDDIHFSSLNLEPIKFTNEKVKVVSERVSEFSNDLDANHLIVITMVYFPSCYDKYKQNKQCTNKSLPSPPAIRYLKVRMSLCADHGKICGSDSEHSAPLEFCSSTLAFSYNSGPDDAQSAKASSLISKSDIFKAGLKILLFQYALYLKNTYSEPLDQVYNALISPASYDMKLVSEDSSNLSEESTVKWFLKSDKLNYKVKCLNNNGNNESIRIQELLKPAEGLLARKCHVEACKPKQFWSLDDCFKEYEKTSTIDGWRCGKEDHPSPSGMNGSRLYKAPPYLIIHLKRFDQVFDEYGNFHLVKKEDNVRYPHVLDISSYIVDRSNLDSTKYMLTAVICHYGNTNYGHYFAYILSKETGEWWEANDERVTPVSKDRVITPLAYILLYRRISEELDKNEREMRKEHRDKAKPASQEQDHQNDTDVYSEYQAGNVSYQHHMNRTYESQLYNQAPRDDDHY